MLRAAVQHKARKLERFLEPGQYLAFCAWHTSDLHTLWGFCRALMSRGVKQNEAKGAPTLGAPKGADAAQHGVGKGAESKGHPRNQSPPLMLGELISHHP